ncbi:MAG: DUF348 domain-containing protein [Clostridiaceae bacterium]|nr:DUF348 domain-containing protein [Clostridiaceae bacterium]
MGSFIFSYAKRSIPLMRIFIVLILLIVSVVSGFCLYNKLMKEVRIVEDGNDIQVKTMGDDVQTVFNQMGILVESYDYVSEPLSMKLSDETVHEVVIRRAVPVNIELEGRKTQVMTYHDTIGETIAANGIVMGPLDRVEGRSLNDPVNMGMDIKIIRVREELITEAEDIPYTTEKTPNEQMNQGEQKVIQEGVNGILEKYYKITYEDNRIVSRVYMDEKVVKEPVTELIEFGTVPNFKTARGDTVRYRKVLDMYATAYTSSFEDTGKHPDHPEFGICYTGMKAREGIIAVDPKVIPLYTKVYVEVVGSTPDYGFAIAGDIGSAIKGNLIDLYFDSKEAVSKWGKKKVRVYILNEQNDTRWKETDYTK